jgi:imidazolonepropionase-like amidohydrolase
MLRHRTGPFVTCLIVLGATLAASPVEARGKGDPSTDLAAARALFARNLEAIRAHDRDAYLACYLKAPTFAVTGPEGAQLGFEAFAAASGSPWPDSFEGSDLQLVSVRSGMVYGTYRYRVRYGAEEQRGISERYFIETSDGWRIAVTSAFPAPPGTPPPPRALVGATLLDGTGGPPVDDAVVVLRGGTVECAGNRAACPVSAGVETIDVAGRWITPGLIDTHVHFAQTGWADGRPDSIDVRERFPYEQVEAGLRAHPEEFFRAFLCSGVTAVFDVGGYPWTWDLRERAAADTLAPRVVASGPLLSTVDFWLNLKAERQFVYLADELAAREAVRYLAAHDTDAVKVWFIVTPERPFEELTAVVMAAGDEARKVGLPLIVHATGLAEAKVALRAGARLLVHGVDDLPVDDEFLGLAKANGVFYCPTLTVSDGYLRMYRAVHERTAPAIDDPNGCIDAATRAKVASTAELPVEWLNERARTPEAVAARAERLAQRNATATDNLKRVMAAGIPVVMGTDAGNPLTLHGPSVYAELEAMQEAGMSAAQVLVAATRDAARALGRGEQLGTLEKGKAADLLVLARNPGADAAAFRRLEMVVRGGEVRPVAELRPPQP